MKIFRIPRDKSKREINVFLDAMKITKELVEQHNLVENRDFDCHYVSGSNSIEIRYYGDDKSVTSFIALKYSL